MSWQSPAANTPGTLVSVVPGVVMIAAGVARKLVFSWLGNPGVGGLGAIRRRIEGEVPHLVV